MTNWNTLRQLIQEKEFEDTSLQPLEPEETVNEGKMYGVFLGCVNMPPATARQDLGRYDVALFILEGKLRFDVLRTTTQHVRAFRPLTLVEYENRGERGRTWDIRVRSVAVQDTELALECIRDSRIEFKGSAAKFFSMNEEEEKKGVQPPTDVRFNQDDELQSKILVEMISGKPAHTGS